jgi:hypothetical protein
MLWPAVSLRQREIASGHVLTGITGQDHNPAASLPAASAVGTAALSGDVLRLAMAT